MVAIVTGGASGIGAAVATRLVEETAVAIWDMDVAKARALAELLSHGEHPAAAYAVDVSERSSVETALAATVSELGTPTSLVNNAGIREITPLLDLDPDKWEQVLRINLSGAFHCLQLVARELVTAGAGGAIVNVSSAAGLNGVPSRTAYCSSKHGVIGLTKVAALELAGHNIRVNAVAPGFILTPLTEAYEHDETMMATVRRMTPLGRWGTAAEVAEVVAFAASDRSSFMTGTVLTTDGGYLAGQGFPTSVGPLADREPAESTS